MLPRRRLEVGEDLLGAGPDAVGPVVEDEDPLVVVAPGLVGVVDDERGVQAAVELQAGVGVEPVRARVGDDEVERERAARVGPRGWSPREPRPCRCGSPARASARTGLRGQVVGDRDADPVPGGGPDRRSRDAVAERPGRRDAAAQVDLCLPGTQSDLLGDWVRSAEAVGATDRSWSSPMCTTPGPQRRWRRATRPGSGAATSVNSRLDPDKGSWRCCPGSMKFR